MLIKVTVENFKSFSEPTEMTMISSTKIQKGTDHRVKIKSTNILKYAVIYGANAAGKSNLIDFFWFLKSTLNDTIPMVATKWFCKCKEENINKNSSFEIQFTIGDKFYAYGFTALLNQRICTSERLYKLCQNGNAKCLFERNEEEKFITSYDYIFIAKRTAGEKFKELKIQELKKDVLRIFKKAGLLK